MNKPFTFWNEWREKNIPVFEGLSLKRPHEVVESLKFSDEESVSGKIKLLKNNEGQEVEFNEVTGEIVVPGKNMIGEFEVNIPKRYDFRFRGVSSRSDFSDIKDPVKCDVTYYDGTSYYYTGEKWEEFGDALVSDDEMKYELMVNDWYYSNGIPKQFKWADWRPGEFGYFIDRYDSIPITPEMMEKNGWERLEHFNVFVKENDPDGILYLGYNMDTKRLSYRDNDKDGGIDCYLRCEYVHELQQLLRRIGRKDMANKFKV